MWPKEACSSDVAGSCLQQQQDIATSTSHDSRLDKAKIWYVRREHGPIPDYRRDLRGHVFLEVGVEGEEVARPGEHNGARLLPSDEQRHQLVPQRPVSHRAPVIVPGCHEAIHEVPAWRCLALACAGRCPLRAAFSDEAVYDLVQFGNGGGVLQGG